MDALGAESTVLVPPHVFWPVTAILLGLLIALFARGTKLLGRLPKDPLDRAMELDVRVPLWAMIVLFVLACAKTWSVLGCR
jgi:hypothetical protein